MSVENTPERADLLQRFGSEPLRRSSGALELELRCLARVARLMLSELRGSSSLSWTERLRAWRHGFGASNAEVYRLGEVDPRAYVSDLEYARRGYKINAFFNPIVGNKFVLSRMLAAQGIPHPDVHAVIVRGRMIDVWSEGGNGKSLSLDGLAARGRAFVFRPHWSGAGEGIFFLRREERGWTINGKDALEDEVSGLIGGLDRFLVTAFVQQASYAAEIYPDAANTLRVLTLIDDDGPFVAAAVHRFGSSRSFPIDNWHQGRGGLCCAIDVETATLGPGATLDADRRLCWLDAHPDTGRPIAGVRIPRLDAALDGILQAATCFPEAPSVGWDAVITEDGFSILEGNAPPGLYVWQVHRPLLTDERVARFFARRGFRMPPSMRPRI